MLPSSVLVNVTSPIHSEESILASSAVAIQFYESSTLTEIDCDFK